MCSKNTDKELASGEHRRCADERQHVVDLAHVDLISGEKWGLRSHEAMNRAVILFERSKAAARIFCVVPTLILNLRAML
jgi:hypothetical protein